MNFFIPDNSDTKKVIFFKMLKSLILLFLLLCGYFLIIIKIEKSTLDKLYWQYLSRQIAYKIDTEYNPIILMYYFHENEIITEQRNAGDVSYFNNSDYYSPSPNNAYKVLIDYYIKVNSNNLELNGNLFDAKGLVKSLNDDSENKYYKFYFGNVGDNHFIKESFERDSFKISVDKYTIRVHKMLVLKSLITDFIIFYLFLISLPILYFLIRMFYTFNINKK